MKDPYAEKMQQLQDSVLRGAGALDTSVRQAAEAGSAVPEKLRPYVDKVAQRAHAVTDEDVLGLRRAGYSEDEIFEVTISTALGAGTSRLEAGLRALKSES